MFKPNNNNSDILERFRIKAHMRRYVKDPFEIDEQLMIEGVAQLKGMDFSHSDPSELVAADMTLKSYFNGLYKLDELTDEGSVLVKQERFRRKHGDSGALHLRVLRSRLN